MTGKDDSAWVFDSLIGFLQGPIWSAPLITFIEEKSLVFEADIEDNDEYHKIYQDYKNLVDLLLGCFMDDMGISPEQFEHACAVNKNTKMPIQFHQNLFEQIWAANEYDIFKRMMIQKNLELQLQALNMIEQKYGLTPASLVYETEGSQEDVLVMEELIQRQALADDSSEDERPVAVKESLIEEHARLTAEYSNERALMEDALKASSSSGKNKNSDVKTREDELESRDKLEEIPKFEKPLPLGPIPSSRKDEPTESKAREEDIKKRQDYLKARRDKLVALKKEARSQRLELNGARPSSARNVAEATIKGQQELKLPEPLEPSIIQIRKALAARLQAEVVRKE